MNDDRVQLDLFSSLTPADLGAIADGFDPERLTQAREAAGLSKARLAELVGVTPAAIGQFEARVTPPRRDLIPELARAVGVPADYFAVGRPFGRVDGSKAHFRSLRSTASKDRAKAIAFIEQVWELTFALEKRVRLPEWKPMALGSDPEEAARRLRSLWGIPAGPLRHLVGTAESEGIVVSLLSMASVDVARVDAFSTSHLDRPVIIITPERARSVFVYRFTVAHEIGHVLLHENAAPGDLQQEREADRFAAELLTPRDQIQNLLPRSMDLARLDEISRKWGVSIESLILRMKEIGVVSEATIRRGYQRLNSLRAASGEAPEPITAYPGEMPSMLTEAARIAESLGVTEAVLARELRWKTTRLREVLGFTDSRPALSRVGDR